MAQKVFKSPLDQANAINPETTRSKWNRYLKNGFSGRAIDKYNKLIQEIESELPFANEIEHQKWLDLGSNWNGEEEWPNLTEELLKRQESPSPFSEIKYNGRTYKRGEDYK